MKIESFRQALDKLKPNRQTEPKKSIFFQFGVDLEVLAEVSYDWAGIVDSIWIADANQKWFPIYGKNITWSSHPQYPACQVLNINKYFMVLSNST